ncbi:MAG: adenylate/guanylate cyclase domain-containing protein, partial [Cyanobacteria bacterium J06553_1]
RMESLGVINRIQVSEDTYRQLKDTYTFEDRGYLLIKGRGEMRAFLLEHADDSGSLASREKVNT